LTLGMTPVISYWKAKDMLWLDGKGPDGNGPCSTDSDRCGDSVKFHSFKLEAMPGQPPLPPTTSPLPSLTPSNMAGDIVALPRIPPVLMTVPPVATLPPLPTGPLVEMLPTVPAVPLATLAPPWNLPSSKLGHTSCSVKGKDCRQTRCCSDAGMQCYLKDQYWAGCRPSCVAGTINPDDAPQWRHPWSCKPLGTRTPDDQTQLGAVLAVFTLQRVATVVAALLLLTGLGLWVWRSRSAANNKINGGLMCHRRNGLASPRPARTGLEALQQRSPSDARSHLAGHLGQSPPPHSHGQPQRAMLQHPFIGALVQHPVARMSSFEQITPSSPQVVQLP